MLVQPGSGSEFCTDLYGAVECLNPLEKNTHIHLNLIHKNKY
jgi:hypothetical protein